jgi:hypothetical protein
MKKMHILGMAKSHMDLEGAKAPKLELDFLKIAYTLARLSALGESGRGFLLVFTESIGKRARGWVEKYGTKDTIEIVVAELTAQELNNIRDEKTKNRDGMLSGSQGQDIGRKSAADIGQEIGETKLRQEIQKRCPDVTRVVDPNKFPLGIRWDFYGQK